ncbi:hypothetical protein [Lacisediminihabitans changchengi]|uniref:Polysaccharide chain length determinant N-terminal domain-containing protein n=1 Tax=Lacisediminihabitans changchengi TaxID=2787634 RepID=A0A934W427_9MICO|nr:hypothetical protein [Lacisediminihabitans changchengi]MBK4348511.1 hypothetical protein [Lacisediminihabitans changchengi]
MYLRDLLRSLVRRWYLLVAGLIITGVAAVGLFSVLPVSYHSSASMVLLPPKTATGDDGNPFLQLGGLNQAVDVLTRTLTSDSESRRILKANPGATFTVAPDGTTSGPIFIATSTAPTAAKATAMTDTIVATVPVALAQIQDGLSVQPESQIDVLVISQDAKPTLDSKIRLQASAGIIALGVALTVVATGLIDGLLRSRRRLRASSRTSGANGSRSAAALTDGDTARVAQTDATTPPAEDYLDPDMSSPTETAVRGRSAAATRRR